MSENKKLMMSFKPEVHKVLKEDATGLGLSMVGYVSMLIMKTRTERQAMNFVASLTPEQIRQAMEEKE